VDSPDLLSSIPQRYLNTLGSLGICGSFGSGVRGAGSSDPSLPTGVGAAIRHSAPLEHRTLSFAPERARGRCWCLSPPAPVGPPAAHCGLARPRYFSSSTSLRGPPHLLTGGRNVHLGVK